MDFIQQDILVSFRYPVHFTRDVFAASNPLLRDIVAGTDDPQPADVLVVLDAGVVEARRHVVAEIAAYCSHHGGVLQLAAPVLVIPGGEQVKNDSRHTAAIHQAIDGGALCRHSYVIAVGGGALLDVAGYAAATAHRGIRLIRVPTTVLSQDDSAIGVKNGINAFGKKNFFGTFAPPFAVINDFSFLSTLAERDWLGGVSEAIKAALIRDAAFFEYLERQAANIVARDEAVMEQVVRRSAALHLAHIASGGDPFEMGSSRPLDFGHWAAHKLEHLSDYRLRHGEAVAIGIALDTTYACLAGFLPEAAWRRVIDLLLALGLAVHAPELGAHAGDASHPRSVLRGLEEFREHLGGRLTIMLLQGIGQAFEVHEIDTAAMIQGIGMLHDIEAARSSTVATDRLPAAAFAPEPS